MFFDEAKAAYLRKFHVSISSSCISVILKNTGLSWKALEQRAVQISQADVIRFASELLETPWLLHNLLFLDEVSFDNRQMIRNCGWWYKGERLVLCGEYKRLPRVSLLCFIGLNGLVNTHMTQGTFNRELFLDCCLQTATKQKVVKMNPGWHSLWILDGAKIHCDPSVVNSLRLIGVKIIFLPAYCPFFNPIEIMFGMVKKRMRRVYNPNRGDDILHVILDVLGEFKRHDFESIFRQCGYTWSGFDPTTAFSIPFSDMHGIKSDGEEIWDVGDVGDYELTE